jgi:P4 family phage/plasmid primase-like protien
LPSKEYQQFWVFVGLGANGKSVLIKLLWMLLGHDNVSAVPFGSLGGRFVLNRLMHARVNVDGDLCEVSRVNESMLKQLTDHSPLDDEPKFESAVTTVYTGRMIALSNVFPALRDRSHAVWRRLVLIPCKAQVVEEVAQLADRLAVELPGLLNRVIAAGKRLIERDGFDIPACCVAAAAEERRALNSVDLWKTACVRLEPGAFSGPMKFVYDSYAKWATGRGYLSMSQVKFEKELRKLLDGEIVAGRVKSDQKSAWTPPGQVRRAMTQRVRGYKGFRIAASLDEVDDAPVEPVAPVPVAPQPMLQSVARRFGAAEVLGLGAVAPAPVDREENALLEEFLLGEPDTVVEVSIGAGDMKGKPWEIERAPLLVPERSVSVVSPADQKEIDHIEDFLRGGPDATAPCADRSSTETAA